MNTFIQYIPRFIDADRPSPIDFDTTSDLLQLEIIEKYKSTEGFKEWAISDELLMAILNDGFSWMVVGYIKHPEELDIPKWEGVKYKAQMADGSIKILTRKEVMSSCGNTLNLRDGTEVINALKNNQ